MKLTQEQIDKIQEAKLHTNLKGEINWKDGDPTSFAFAGPDEFKHDKTIDIFTAYKRYIASKPWAASNYLRDPSRKPDWL